MFSFIVSVLRSPCGKETTAVFKLGKIALGSAPKVELRLHSLNEQEKSGTYHMVLDNGLGQKVESSVDRKPDVDKVFRCNVLDLGDEINDLMSRLVKLTPKTRFLIRFKSVNESSIDDDDATLAIFSRDKGLKGSVYGKAIAAQAFKAKRFMFMSNMATCHKKVYTVDFRALGWANWIIHPLKYRTLCVLVTVVPHSAGPVTLLLMQ